MEKKVTRQQYLQARKALKSAQRESVSAIRKGDQPALDQASQGALAAMAVIAAYKDQPSY